MLTRILNTIHLTALGLWAGAILATGAAAAVAFPTMKGLDPSLPEFAAYPEDHWRIAAGQVMNKVFHVLDAFGLIAAAVAAVTLAGAGAIRGANAGRVGPWIRIGAVIAAAGLVGVSAQWLHPTMDAELTAFIDAAKSGDADDAQRHRAAFDEWHPAASNLMAANLIAVLVALVAGAWASAPGGARGGAPEAPDASAP